MDSWSAIASCMVLRTIVTRPTDQAIRRNVLILQQSGDDTARNLCFIVPFPDGELGIEQRVLLGLFHLVLVEDAPYVVSTHGTTGTVLGERTWYLRVLLLVSLRPS